MPVIRGSKRATSSSRITPRGESLITSLTGSTWILRVDENRVENTLFRVSLNFSLWSPIAGLDGDQAGDVMRTATRAWRILSTVIMIAAISSAAAAQDPTQAKEPAPSPKPQPTNKYVIRGCLTGSTLAEIEPLPTPVELPAKLRVARTRKIHDQVKPLRCHQVELTGALFGVPGVEEGVLIGDSGAVKVYIGGADPNLGQDLAANRNDRPTIRATMIKDVAPVCV